jgi:Protein of unknown function (DUF3987)
MNATQTVNNGAFVNPLVASPDNLVRDFLRDDSSPSITVSQNEGMEAVPTELKDLQNWVTWKDEIRGSGKATKVLYNASTGFRASSVDSKTWTTFERSRRALGSNKYDGIGLVITPPYIGIDLDNCRDAETGVTQPWALEVIKELNSYTELSPSKRGYHVWVRGVMPGDGSGKKNGPIEMYGRDRYFTVTGEHVEGTPLRVHTRKLDTFYEKHFSKSTSTAQSTKDTSLSAKEYKFICDIVRELGESASEDEIKAELFERVESGKAPEVIQFREKWDRKDYISRTIQAAIRAVNAKPNVASTLLKVKSETSALAPSAKSSEDKVDAKWPAPMAEEAFYGLAGDFVRSVEPHTEADPAALLANFLVAAGVLFGREAYIFADGKRHYPVEYLLMAGATGAGRKGTATARVLPLMEEAQKGYFDRVLNGLSSAEGLVKAISARRDELPDKVRSFLVLLPEFASLLGVMKREGNTMSPVLREAWDGGRLRVLTRKEPLDVDNVNLSVIAHITPSELLKGLTETERVNGFANRFLIICVRRSKFLPEGGEEMNPVEIAKRLQSAVDAARGRGQIRRDKAARELWALEYPRLTGARDGLIGALCSRSEAHVLRLSLLYALLDGAEEIRVEHLRAALAVWEYCERSVNHIFGGTTGDPEEDKLVGALAKGPCTLSDLHRVFGNHRTGEWLSSKLAEMVRTGSIEPTEKGSKDGRVAAWKLKVSQ